MDVFLGHSVYSAVPLAVDNHDRVSVILHKWLIQIPLRMSLGTTVAVNGEGRRGDEAMAGKSELREKEVVMFCKFADVVYWQAFIIVGTCRTKIMIRRSCKRGIDSPCSKYYDRESMSLLQGVAGRYWTQAAITLRAKCDSFLLCWHTFAVFVHRSKITNFTNFNYSERSRILRILNFYCFECNLYLYLRTAFICNKSWSNP